MDIDVQDLTKVYPRGDTYGLRNVSFGCRSGRITGIIGPNGSGKTTFARILVGLLRPTSGQVEVGEKQITASSGTRLNVGYVPQFVPAFPGMTSGDLIDFVLITHGLRGRAKRAAAEWVVGLLEIEDLLQKRVWDLSTGQARLVLLACALGPRPPLIVLDEPSSGLDYFRRRKLWDTLLAIKQLWKPTVVLITHDVRDAEPVMDDAIVLKGGKVVLSGDVGGIRHGDDSLRIRVHRESQPSGEGWQPIGANTWQLVTTREGISSVVHSSVLELLNDSVEIVIGGASLEDRIFGGDS